MPFLVAIDLSAPSRRAIEVAALLARATGLEPLLVHVSERPPALRQLADLYALAEPLRAFGSTPHLRIAEGEPARCICEQAEHRGCAFVVMGTRGHSGAAAQAPGSVARAVMATCRIPVIAVRPQADPGGVDGDQDPDGREVIALMEAGRASGTAHRIARFLVEAVHGSLVRVPPVFRWRDGIADPILHAPRATHLVLSVDPRLPTPTWVDRLLDEEPGPLLLVSDLPFPGPVPDATPLG
jgi:nucleotide-binding universal stress UspA family protein